MKYLFLFTLKFFVDSKYTAQCREK